MARGSSPSPLLGVLGRRLIVHPAWSPCRVPAATWLWDCRGLQQAALRARARGPTLQEERGSGSADTGVAGAGVQEGAGRRPAVLRRSGKASGLGARNLFCFSIVVNYA